MPGRGSALSKLITAAIFIILEVAAILMLNSSEKQAEWISKGSGGFKAFLWEWTEDVGDYFNLKDQNRRLAAENDALYSRLHKAEQVLANHAIDSVTLADYDMSQDYTFIGARIVTMSKNKGHNYIILDKGSADGVSADDGILTTQGVVGIVDVVSEHYAYGRTILNRGLSISARLGRDGIVSPLVWDGKSSSTAEMLNIPLHITYEKGDTVFTSGQSLIYPGNIPIGTVVEEFTKDGASSCLKVDFLFDFSALRYVRIAHLNSKDEIKELEAQGGKI